MIRGPNRKRGEGWCRASSVIDTDAVLCVSNVCACLCARLCLAGVLSSGRRADTYKGKRQGCRRWTCKASGLGQLGASAPGRKGRVLYRGVRSGSSGSSGSVPEIVSKGNGCEGPLVGVERQGSGKGPPHNPEPQRDSGISTCRWRGKGPIGSRMSTLLL